MRNTMLLLTALMLSPSFANAEGDQLYFVGYVAPTGSISSDGAASGSVYLRWDLVEGGFPSDLARIRLERVGEPQPLLDVAIDEVMSAPDIASLYAAPGQSRRGAETLDALARAAEDGDSGANAGNFAATLRAKLSAAAAGDETERYWAQIAGRIDFNVARASHRGYAEAIPPGATATYRLIGVSIALDEAELGEVTVDLAAPKMLDGAALEQVSIDNLSRCDAPESARSHGVVALTWDHPGKSRTERYANAINVAGYDLYRTVDPVAGPPALPPAMDLRTLASGLGHGPAGEMQFPGLQKVNTVPIVISGLPEPGIGGRPREGQHTGWNPEFVQFQESKAELAAAGLKPGDIRGYYLVARDLSGNYGHTSRLTVVVPDALEPPAPWAVEAIRDSRDDVNRVGLDPALADGNDQMLLRWAHVDVANYHREHNRDRTWCNLDTATLDQRLRFAPGERGCGGAEVEVNLAVHSYVIYRFESEIEAKAFTDSDGDGVADLDERKGLLVGGITPLMKNGVQLTEPGAACDENVALGKNHKVIEIAASAYDRTTVDGRTVIEWTDKVPAQTKGKVFWYRVAARGLNKRVGELGPPVRALFPNELKPKRPQVLFGECSYHAYLLQPPEPEAIALDLTQDAEFVRFTCRRQDAIENPEGGADVARREGELELANGPQLRADFDEPAMAVQPDDARAEADLGEVDAQRLVLAERANANFENANLANANLWRERNDLVAHPGGVAQIGQVLNMGSVTFPLKPFTDEANGVTSDAGLCRTLLNAANRCDLVAQFVGEGGLVLAEVAIEKDDFHNEAACFTAVLEKDCEERLRPIRPGQVVDGEVVLDFGPLDDCVDVFSEVDGESRRLTTLCPGDWPWTFQPPNLGGDLWCLSVSVKNENNMASTDLELPCFKLDPGPPPPPAMEEIDFAGTDGSIRWRAPEQPTAGTIMEIYPKGFEYRRVSFFGHEGRFGADELHTGILELTPVPPVGEQEIWCARGRSVGWSGSGSTGTLSDWSAPLCAVRAVDIPEYLPWPKVEVPPHYGPNLPARYMSTDGRLAVLLGGISIEEFGIGENHDGTCNFLTGVIGCNEQQSCIDDAAQFFWGCNFCDLVRNALGGLLRFTAYRQSRKPGSAATAYAQISPYIDKAHCGRMCPDADGDFGFGGAGDVANGGGVLGHFDPIEGGAGLNLNNGNGLNVNNGLRRPVVGELPDGECISYLHDPWVKLLLFPINDPWRGGGLGNLTLTFVDRSPHIAGYEYRYQFVFFDEDGEITGHRETPWVTAPGL